MRCGSRCSQLSYSRSDGSQVLIFAEKKADVDAIHEYLLLKGVEAVAIHGDKGMSLLTGVGVGG